jgi:5-(carboxyamino)imidazole ribonucleotide synthase
VVPRRAGERAAATLTREMDTRTGLPVVGMVGGGQLARMTHQAAIALGQSLRVLAVAPDDGAALVAADVHTGHHTDLAALRTFAKGCDVVTFDHEHVPTEHIRALAADGVTVHPPAEALRYAQDKRAMRERLTELAVPVPRWRPVASAAELNQFAAEAGWPVVAKAARGGYDGRGVWLLDGPAPAAELVAAATELIVEERVALRRELAVLVGRSPFGQVAAYPVVETVQRDGVCVEVLAPAPDLPEDRAVAAQELAIGLATSLGVVGLLAVELFEVAGSGELLVNELAMRPHNSGHWTIEGARTSQFEQHLRAVLDYPMGDTGLTAPAVVMANVLGGEDGGMSLDERLHHLFAADPAVKVHMYGKQVRPGRKIGHVTALGDDPATVRARARRASRWLREGR